MRGKSLGLVGFLAVALGVGACQQKEANEPPKGKNGPVPSVTANGKSEGPSRVDVNLNTEKPETADDEKETKISVKVLLPQDDAKVSIDGKEIEGKGETRTVEAVIPEGKMAFTVSAFWEPNNYTKITRKRKIELKGKTEFKVDLREEDLIKEKDDIVVRYVPTPDDVVDAMCKMAKVTKSDVVYDLGCGDGRMVITAVKKFGAKRGVGVELDPDLVKKCKEAAKEAGVEKQVEFREGDVLKVTDLSDATVVLLYMGDDINKRLKPILQSTLKQGSRVVSHRFLMGDDWKPLKTETIHSTAGYDCLVHLWIIKGKKE